MGSLLSEPDASWLVPDEPESPEALPCFKADVEPGRPETEVDPLGRADIEVFHEAYEVKACLGKGAYAQVYRAQSVGLARSAAVKIVDMWAQGQSKLQRARSNCAKEARILRIAARSDFCIGGIAEYADERLFYLVMQLGGRSLFDMLEGTHVSEWSLRRVFRDILLALQYLHMHNVVHRDVKVDNMLCSEQPGGIVDRVRLADFGLAQFLQPGKSLMGVAGTAPFMCPEMLSKQSYNAKADVWSLGAVAYVLLTGRYPYMSKKMTSESLKKSTRLGRKLPSFRPAEPGLRPSAQAVTFVSTLLERDPVARPDANAALESPFVLGATTAGVAGDSQGPSLRPLFMAARRIGAFSAVTKKSTAALDRIVAGKQEQFLHARLANSSAPVGCETWSRAGSAAAPVQPATQPGARHFDRSGKSRTSL